MSSWSDLVERCRRERPEVDPYRLAVSLVLLESMPASDVRGGVAWQRETAVLIAADRLGAMLREHDEADR